jgi:hypothetical protein
MQVVEVLHGGGGGGGLQREGIYLGRPIALSYMSPNPEGGGVLLAQSTYRVEMI